MWRFFLLIISKLLVVFLWVLIIAFGILVWDNDGELKALLLDGICCFRLAAVCGEEAGEDAKESVS